MTAADAENSCGLAARISRLTDGDRRLVELFVGTLEARRRGDGEDPLLRIRRRIEAVRNLPKD